MLRRREGIRCASIVSSRDAPIAKAFRCFDPIGRTGLVVMDKKKEVPVEEEMNTEVGEKGEAAPDRPPSVEPEVAAEIDAEVDEAAVSEEERPTSRR